MQLFYLYYLCNVLIVIMILISVKVLSSSYLIEEMPHLSIIEKARIICLEEIGWSYGRIADHFRVPRSTVQGIVKKWRYHQTLERSVGSGLNNRKSSNEEDRNLVEYLRQNPFETALSAMHRTGFPTSSRTAQRRVRQCSELRNRAAASKPFLKNSDKEQRIGFAMQYLPENDCFWQNVIFSDEKTFQSTYNGRIRVYRPPNSRYDEKYTQKKQTSGRFSVNVWAWISVHGAGVCWNIGGTLNSNIYLQILENVFLPSAAIFFERNNFIFQQDNCPVHTARNVGNWFRENNVTCLPWCSRSPDLNPIENVWGLMVKEMYKINFKPQNEIELFDKIEEIWEGLTPDYTRSIILSMPRRLRLVLESNGAAIKY